MVSIGMGKPILSFLEVMTLKFVSYEAEGKVWSDVHDVNLLCELL